MFVLRLTSDPALHGMKTDDDFTIGSVTPWHLARGTLPGLVESPAEIAAEVITSASLLDFVAKLPAGSAIA
jgi:hypothetical protein